MKQRYEHVIRKSIENWPEKIIDQLQSEGWELCSVCIDAVYEYYLFYWKRPVEEMDAQEQYITELNRRIEENRNNQKIDMLGALIDQEKNR